MLDDAQFTEASVAALLAPVREAIAAGDTAAYSCDDLPTRRTVPPHCAPSPDTVMIADINPLNARDIAPEATTAELHRAQDRP